MSDTPQINELHPDGPTHSCWDVNLEQIQNDLIVLAKRAGEKILAARPSTFGPSLGTKKNSVDLVTETDKAVEKVISHTLQAKYCTFKFLGEETYHPGMRLTNAPTFVVDPIDGTTNFVHGYPYVSISLGLTINRIPKVGVVYNPFTNQLYTGIRGQGSYLTGPDGVKHRLPLRRPEPLHGLSEALVATEWGSDRDGPNWDCKVKTWANLGKSKEQGGAMIHSARSLGSAALNLCAVASGSIDVYWEGGCWAWDVCAGMVILREAGGVVVDGNPGTWDIPVDHRKYLAVRGAPEGQSEIVQEFWGYIDGSMDYSS